MVSVFWLQVVELKKKKRIIGKNNFCFIVIVRKLMSFIFKNELTNEFEIKYKTFVCII